MPNYMFKIERIVLELDFREEIDVLTIKPFEYNLYFFLYKIKIISNKAQHDYEDTKHVFDKIV